MDCDLQSTGLRPQPAWHTCTFWFPPCQLSGTFSYGYIPVIIHVFVQFVQQLRFRYFQAAVYCITINALCFPVSTYHLVFEPYFHFPLGSLSGTEHLRPPTLNEQPALYIPYGNTKKQNNPRAHSYQSPAPYSSDRLCMNDGNLIPPAAKIVPDVTSYRVSLSVGKEEEEKKYVGETSPGALLPHQPLPTLTVSLYGPSINVELRWSYTALHTLHSQITEEPRILNVTGTLRVLVVVVNINTSYWTEKFKAGCCFSTHEMAFCH